MPRMNIKHRRSLTAAVAVAVVGTVAAVALGSPGSGRVTTLLVAQADNNQTIHLNSDRIKFQTKDPTDVRVQTITFAPGGYSAWNHKPGFAIVAVQRGGVPQSYSQCTGTTSGPDSPNGAVFVEYGDEPEEVRNTSSAPATVYATLVAPHADPAVFRIEDDP